MEAMKVLLLALILPLCAYAAKDLSCDQYGKMLPDLEKKLMGQTLRDCGDYSPQILLGSSDDSFKEDVDRYKCQDLSLIDANTTRLQSELDLLAGFQKLKADIKAEKENMGSRVLKSAQEAGKNFTVGVVTAQSLELLISDKNPPELLKKLRETVLAMPEKDKADPGIFINKVRSFCPATITVELNACHSSFKPTVEAVKEINQLLASSDGTDEQVAGWRSTLAIKKVDGSDYSFSKMYDDMKDALPKLESEEMGLTRDELKALQSLPDFEDASKIGSLASLKDNRKEFKMQELLEQFKFLSGDMKARQEKEVQSKISLAWSKYGSDLGSLADEDKNACANVLEDYKNADTCTKALQKALPDMSSGSAKTYLDELKDSLEANQNYLDEITSINDQCLNSASLKNARQNGKLSPECEKLLPDIDSDIAKKQKSLLVLNTMKNKIAAENERLRDFRDYVLEKMVNLKCGNTESSTVEFCPQDPAFKTAREALILTSSFMDISIVQYPKEDATDVSKYCEDEKLLSYEQRICESEKASAEEPEKPKAPRQVSLPQVKDDAPVSVKSRGSGQVSSAWRNGLIGLAGTIGQGLFNPNPYGMSGMYGYNPYMYGYSPYPSFTVGTPAIGNSWVQMNSQFYGNIGAYQPTFGMTPYTAFPVYNSYYSTPYSSYFSTSNPIP
jgi:hypothetical protein